MKNLGSIFCSFKEFVSSPFRNKKLPSLTISHCLFVITVCSVGCGVFFGDRIVTYVKPDSLGTTGRILSKLFFASCFGLIPGVYLYQRSQKIKDLESQLEKIEAREREIQRRKEEIESHDKSNDKSPPQNMQAQLNQNRGKDWQEARKKVEEELGEGCKQQ